MSPTRKVSFVQQAFPERPAFDTGVSSALLQFVSSGKQLETLRFYRPGAVVGFGAQDVASAGYLEAVAAARCKGFNGVQRLAGGRAAVFHRGTIAFAWTIPDPSPRLSILKRFAALSGIVERALQRLGVDAIVGEVNGEYCPGAYTVNARGRTKIMGVGQRLGKGAAHMEAVVVVNDAASIRRVLVPIYHALELSWKPGTVGSVEDEIGPVLYEDVATSIRGEFSEQLELVEDTLSSDVLALAESLQPRHTCPDYLLPGYPA